MASQYDPQYCDFVADFCALGATNEVLAEAFGVAVKTITAWRERHPDFDAAIRNARFQADTLAAQSLFKRAIGFTISKEVVMKCKDADGNERLEKEVISVEIPPSESACKAWLGQRRPSQWGDNAKDPEDNVAKLFASIMDKVMDTSRGLPHDGHNTTPSLSYSTRRKVEGVTIDADTEDTAPAGASLGLDTTH